MLKPSGTGRRSFKFFSYNFNNLVETVIIDSLQEEAELNLLLRWTNPIRYTNVQCRCRLFEGFDHSLTWQNLY